MRVILPAPDPDMAHFHDGDPEVVQRRLEAIAAEEASRRRRTVRSLGAMVASIALSLLVMGWGFSMDDPDLGPTLFLGGALVGNTGILLSLLWAYRSREG